MTPPPETVGVFFAADFMKREKQICETSHHTPQYASLDMNAVKRFILPFFHTVYSLDPIRCPPAVIRTDPVPESLALINVKVLNSQRLSIEKVNVKTQIKMWLPNILELQKEILRLQPEQITMILLTMDLSVFNINPRLLDNGIFAKQLPTRWKRPIH